MDDRYLLSTPENVPVSFELAGLGSRVVASVIDQFIMAGVTIGAGVAVYLGSLFFQYMGYSLRGDMVAPLLLVAALIWLLVYLAGYDLLFEILWNGQTPGKRRAGIRVVRSDGSPITGVAAVIRNLIRMVDWMPSYYIIGVICILIDRKSRRLGDLAAGTIVVKERRALTPDHLTLSAVLHRPDASQGSVEAAQPDPIEDAAVERYLHRLGPDDYYLIKEFLLRQSDLSPTAKQPLANAIAERVATKLEITSPIPDALYFLMVVARALERTGSR